MTRHLVVGLLAPVAALAVLMTGLVVPCSASFDPACGAILLNSSSTSSNATSTQEMLTVELYASMDVNISQVELYFKAGGQPQYLNFYDLSGAGINQSSTYSSNGNNGDPYNTIYFRTFTFSPEAQLKAGSFYQLEMNDYTSECTLRLGNGTLSNSNSTGVGFSCSYTIFNNTQPDGAFLVVPSLAFCGSASTPSPSPSPSPPPPPPSFAPVASPSSNPPSISASPSALPRLVVATKVSADFANATVAFNMSASFSTSNSSSSSVSATSVRSDLVEVQVGNVSVPAASLANLTVTRANDSALGTSGVTYAALLLDAASRFEQTFALFTRDTATSFAGVSFTVGANSVKWTLNLTSSSAAPATGDHRSEWSVVRYRLSSVGLLAGGGTSGSNNGSSTPPTYSTPATPIVRANTPTANQTTFFLPLFATTTTSSKKQAQEVTITPIRHSIVPVATYNSTKSAEEVNEYEVVLELPPFNLSLLYDPSVSLGLLVGADRDGSGGGSGSDNTALIVGVAVAVPVALTVVVVVVAAAAAVTWWKRLQRGVHRGSVNFSHEDDL